MALIPSNYSGKEKLQPGARGEIFQTNIPGYRDNADRVNRTNSKLNTSAHDVLSIQYELDRKLPVLFKYGYAVGYNQVIIPKGRLVALDPYANQLDWDMHKRKNVVTLANGGMNVKLGPDGKNWVELKPEENADLQPADSETGLLKLKDGTLVRPANRPMGMNQRNEYTRDDDALNGMMVGAILTDCMVELPLFIEKDKAEANPWGSVYGADLCPGDYVKSDANGRFVKSPLSNKAWLLAPERTAGEIELERQQVVGQVYEISRDLLPAGAARFAQWALSDRLNFEQFNPDMWRANGRRGEDLNENSPYTKSAQAFSNTMKAATPGEDLVHGYGYDNNISDHDLHMLASTARKSDNRFGLEYQLENGIPGLTDGYNAVERKFGPELALVLHAASSKDAYTDQYLKTANVDVEKGTIEIAVTEKTVNELTDADFTPCTTVEQGLKVYANGAVSAKELLKVTYLNELQGMIRLSVKDAEAYHTLMTSAKKVINVFVKYKKRGLAGVPTFLDWDGCQGTCQILLQK